MRIAKDTIGGDRTQALAPHELQVGLGKKAELASLIRVSPNASWMDFEHHGCLGEVCVTTDTHWLTSRLSDGIAPGLKPCTRVGESRNPACWRHRRSQSGKHRSE